MKRKKFLHKAKKAELIQMKKDMPDLKLGELARAFGVSISTASNVINQHKQETLKERQEEIVVHMDREKFKPMKEDTQGRSAPDPTATLIKIEEYLRGLYAKVAEIEVTVKELRDERKRNTIPDIDLLARQ